ncbi:MAG: hypothetical protein ACLFVT_04645 [Syntrophobacteria bacterium]
MLRPKKKHINAVTLLSENLRSYNLMLRLAEQTREELLAGKWDGLVEKFVKRRRIEQEISARDRIIEASRQQLAAIPLDEEVSELVKKSVSTIAEIQELDRKTCSFICNEYEPLAEPGRVRPRKKCAGTFTTGARRT